MDPLMIAYGVIFVLGLLVVLFASFGGDMDIDSDGFAVSPFLIGIAFVFGGLAGILMTVFSHLHPGWIALVAVTLAVGAYAGTWKMKHALLNQESNSVRRSE